VEIREKQLKQYLEIVNSNYEDFLNKEALFEKSEVILAGTPSQKLKNFMNREISNRVSNNFLIKMKEKFDFSILKDFLKTAPFDFYRDFLEYKTEFSRLPGRK